MEIRYNSVLIVLYTALQCDSMFNLRNVECLACGSVGLTAYGQCKKVSCGKFHKVTIHD